MNHSDEITALAGALAKAQGAMTDPKRTSENPYFKSSYADLGEVVKVSREPLSKNGLSVVQTVASNTEVVAVTTTLLHESGQWMSDTASFPLGDKTTIQQVGSVVTYLRRYSLMAILGLAPVDDDGNSGPEVEKPKERAIPPAAQAVIADITKMLAQSAAAESEKNVYRKKVANAHSVKELDAIRSEVAAMMELDSAADAGFKGAKP